MRYDIHELPAAAPNPGRTLFLLGQAKDGPVNSPVAINSLQEAERIFQYGNLVDAYKQVKDIAGITVYLMRITGDYARLSLLGTIDGETTPVLSFRSIYGGGEYNYTRIHTGMVERQGAPKKALIIESSVSSIPNKSYVLDDYGTIQELLYDINRDTRLKRGIVYASSRYANYPVTCLGDLNNASQEMQGGSDGLDVSKDELYIALDTSYSILEGREVDVICPFPVRFDDTHPAFYYGGSTYGSVTYGSRDYLALVDADNNDQHVTFHGQLIRFCHAQERFGIVTHGVIGLNEVANPNDMTPYYLSHLVQKTALKDRYELSDWENGAWVDRGHNITVFAQDFIFGDMIANGCAMYAGMVAALNPNQTTTNRPIPEGIELAFELDPREVRDLASIGVVSCRVSVKQGPVIANGVTASLPDSPFYTILNTRMVQFALHTLNSVTEEMVGETFIPVITLKEAQKKVDEALKRLVQSQVLKDYELGLNLNAETMTLGINLRIMPRYSTEFIDAATHLKFSNTGGNA